MSAVFKLSRRSVIQAGVAVGGGLMLGCVLPSKKSAASGNGKAATTMNAFVQIDTNGAVTLTAPRPECGTGVKTSLVMLLAEELGVDFESVKVVQATGDGQKFGNQNIGGSQSIRTSWGPLRAAGATAAFMLRQAAAQKWGVDVSQCKVDNGAVVGANSGQRLTFGELAEAASKLPVPERSLLILKSPGEYKIIGKAKKRVDGLDIVTGKAVFGIDSRPKGAKVAVIARPPAFGGRVSKYDEAAAKKVPGVTHVIQTESGIAVVANDTWSAMKGREALNAEFDAGPNGSLTSAELTSRFKAAVQAFPEMPAGAKTLEAVYELPFLSHAPLEPMNCVADVRTDSAEIWAPTQVPDGARGVAAQAAGLSQSQVTVHLPLVGGGFGRRLSNEYVGEAVAISKAVGAPVQVLWTRDDDMRHDNYRPMTYHAMKGGVDADGNIVAFYHQALRAGSGGRGGSNWSARAQSSYNLPSSGTLGGAVPSSVPVGAWRSVDDTFMGFVTECFFDELCALAKKDPMDTRIAMSGGRIKACLELAKEKSGWGKPLPAGWGRGVAVYDSFGSTCAHVAEVEVKKDGSVKVHRVVSVAGCGTVINPLGAAAQLEGAISDGIACLLYAQITIDGGGAAESSWGEFGWSRIPDMPKVEVHFLPSQDAPSGLGEPGFPPAGPAVANAIFAASGKRIRKVPIGGKVA